MCKVKKCEICGIVKEMCGVCGSVCQQYLPLYFRKHGANGISSIFDQDVYNIASKMVLERIEKDKLEFEKSTSQCQDVCFVTG